MPLVVKSRGELPSGVIDQRECDSEPHSTNESAKGASNATSHVKTTQRVTELREGP
jgi:hypothetical protein